MPSIMYNEKFKQINLYKDAYIGEANMETYPLGKLLCDFLNLDLKKHTKIKVCFLSFLKRTIFYFLISIAVTGQN